jgi:hypothetical protein
VRRPFLVPLDDAAALASLALPSPSEIEKGPQALFQTTDVCQSSSRAFVKSVVCRYMTESFEHLVPSEGLRRFLDERFGASATPPVVSKLGDGHSNLTFRVRRDDEQWVLRRPPRG